MKAWKLISKFFPTFVFSLLVSIAARSAAIIQLDYILFTDKTTVDTSISGDSKKSLYNINILFSTNSKKTIYFGWGLYNVLTKDIVNNQEANYSTQDMGPSFRYEFSKNGLFYFGAIYGIRASTKFDTGGTAEEWLGTNYLLQLGVNPELNENFYVDFAFNYFSGSVNKKVVSSVQTEVTYTKAFMAPSIGLTYKW